MKKLMIIATVALCASFANAASFTWGTSGNMTDGSSTLTSMKPENTSLALVYLGSDAGAIDWTTAQVVDTALPSFASSMGTASAKVNKTFEFSMSDYGNGDIFGVVLVDSNDKLYYLQQGGANMTPTYTITGLTADNTPLSAFTFASSSFSGTTDPSAAVVAAPEPTSGLLILLGMAGLALRRKQKNA